jgi:Transposase DDE domain
MSSSVATIAAVQKRIGEMLPGLSKAEAQALGLLSYGILLFNGCGLTRLSKGLAKIEQVPAGRLRQRLREFSYEAEAKRGNKRREVKVEACFADLLRSVLRGWEGKKELALAMDASTLGERFTVLSISVMYRGCGIPIAWKIIPAMQEGEWRPYWEGLLSTFEGVVPLDWKVILMADRGLYAAWLYQAIVKLGWHPMLRVKEDLSFRARGEETFSPMEQRVKRRGRGWSGKGEWSEHGERMEGTVLIRWEKGYEEKLVVVTDLNEKEANAAWYQMRFWIEDEYKDHKSGGWGWEQTKMTDPGRAERQWLARAVAMQMAVLIGGQEEAEEQERKRRKAKGKRRVGKPPKPVCRPRAREQSVLMAGQQSIQAAVARGEEIPMGHVVTEEWPKQTYRVAGPTKSWAIKCREKEAKKRHQKNKQAREREAETTPTQGGASKQAHKQHGPKMAKHVRKRQRVQQEREAKRFLVQQMREERKREQEERRLQKQREQEERKQEKEHKRERRLRERQEREQERLWRTQWHEQVKRKREQCQARTQERMARRAAAAVASSSASSRIFADDQALVPLPKPP